MYNAPKLLVVVVKGAVQLFESLPFRLHFIRNFKFDASGIGTGRIQYYYGIFTTFHHQKELRLYRN
jgi:hypothetical protein